MGKRIPDVIKTSVDINQITGAIAAAIDPHDVEENLRQLGFDVQVSEIDWRQWATITIEGGENETGVILTLQLAKIEIGFDSLTMNHEKEEGE